VRADKQQVDVELLRRLYQECDGWDLRYSKRRYLKFYRTFNRFRRKCFFHEALTYWGYAARRCIIDNTNLARLRGTGEAAVMVPEMAAFGAHHGFEYVCHEVRHSDRKELVSYCT